MVRLASLLAAVATFGIGRIADAGQCAGVVVTVDNDDPGSGYSEVQPENFQSHNVDACADTYRYLSKYVGDESTDGRVIWQPTIEMQGTYRVTTGFRASENRTDDADYVLIGDDGSQQAMVIDQRGDGCVMAEIGEVWCVPGGSCRLELDGTDDMKSDAADLTTFELVDCEPPEPSPCDALGPAGFEVCGSGPTTCEGVYNAGEGCIALCAAVGMMCVERYGGEPGCLQEDVVIPCDEVNDHASNYCVCQGEPPPDTTSGGDEGTGAAEAGGGDTGGELTGGDGSGSAEGGGAATGSGSDSTGVPPIGSGTAPWQGDDEQTGSSCACTSGRDDDRAGWLALFGFAALVRRRRAWALGATVAMGCSGEVVEFAETSTTTGADTTTPSTTGPATTPSTSAPASESTAGTADGTSGETTAEPTTETTRSTDPSSDTSAATGDPSSESSGSSGGGESSTTGGSTRGMPCLSEGDCEADAPICLYGFCQDGSEDDLCISDAECGPGLVCVFALCKDGSVGDACIDDNDCNAAPFCVGSACRLGNEGDPCIDDNDCDAAPFCAQAQCHDGSNGDPCVDDNDCDAAPFCVFSTCEDGLEEDPCLDDNDCDNSAPNCVGAHCYDGSDGDPCVVQNDCINACAAGLCN